MFRTLEPLDHIKHRQLRHLADTTAAFAREVYAVPLGVREITIAMRHFPIVFNAPDAALPHALLSADGASHGFMGADGTWSAPYIPAHVRRYPFILGRTQTAGSYVVMLDSDSKQLGTEAGERLFDDSGARTPYLNGIVKFLEAFQTEIAAAESLFAPIVEAKLLAPLEIRTQTREGAALSVLTLYAVDSKRLDALAPETLAKWQKSGLLAMLYAHLFSLANVASLRTDRVAA